jgi:hypothetical protein
MTYQRRNREFERRLCEIADRKRSVITPKLRQIAEVLRAEIAHIFSQCVRTIGRKGPWQHQNVPLIFL